MNSRCTEMEVDGQPIIAFEDDSCYSLESLSLSSETTELEVENLRSKDDPQINLPSTSSEIPEPDRFVMLICSQHKILYTYIVYII